MEHDRKRTKKCLRLNLYGFKKMILHHENQKIKFLQECYDEITRIFSESSSTRTNANEPSQLEEEDKINSTFATSELPQSLSLSNHDDSKRFANLKKAKLDILIKIYNQVASKFCQNKQNSINLETIFSDIKSSSLVKLVATGFNPNEIMLTHRSSWRRNSIQGKVIGIFFNPRCASFLKKYGYFEASFDNSTFETPHFTKTQRQLFLKKP